jgi:hypothetical protein
MTCRHSPLVAATPLAALLLVAAPSHAVIVLGNGESVNMSALFAQGSDRMVQIDDKIFTFQSFTSSQFQMQNFTVIGFISNSVNQWGLHNVGFDLTGPFGDGSPGDGLAHEFNLNYTVAVTPEAWARDVRLCDTHLLFNGSAGGTGSYARVDETVWALDTNTFLGNLSAYDHFGPPRMTKLQDDRNFAQITGNTQGWRAFEVNKDLKFFAASRSDFATASFVRQEFSQMMAPAPGAATLIGLSGAFARRRRR